MIYIFLDTETTGLPLFKERSTHPDQPRIIQLGYIKADHNKNILAQRNLLIKPDGWEISQFITDLTGHTMERCEAEGITMKEAYDILTTDAKGIDYFVAHNKMFDRKLLKIEATRLGMEDTFPTEWLCTMVPATKICKLPNQNGYGGYKWPKLTEAYPIICGRPLEGAHDAMADVAGCMDIFFAMNPPKVAA